MIASVGRRWIQCAGKFEAQMKNVKRSEGELGGLDGFRSVYRWFGSVGKGSETVRRGSARIVRYGGVGV